MRRPVLGILVLFGVLSVALAGCQAPAGDDGGASGPAVTVSGKLGTATIAGKPKRVVAMSWTDADFPLALGIKPVGMARVPTREDGIQPWTKEALGATQPTLFDVNKGDPIDQVAALKPDLIVATKDYNLKDSYDRLSKLAPVISYDTAPNSDSWQDSLTKVGTATGKSDQAEAAIAATDKRIADAAKANPDLAGKTFSFGVQPGKESLYVVNSTDDVTARLLVALGMRLNPTVTSLPTSSIPGRAQLSYENLQAMDADVVLVTGTGSTLANFSENPVAKSLNAVRRGAYIPLQPTPAQAMAFPSSESLDWVLDTVVPQLVTAAKRPAQP
ncbi:iron-siderophore ABC transporter substrate-binding protein [Williamsia sterculiae]|uniref:Iron complex transport system substrate-binding protein n=1 Tax=Williamsia sterculiae TaxID=1344003 RepID=A0A1N7H1P8_9NOCA|nr:iron-siderophore ABC transporter substrate-binding protein [Williamsia sterculiae]SIS18777.1 iron complex transport system substrate-binding protein [Williamsia sterculiae]